MSSVAFSTGYSLPNRSQQVYQPTQPAGRQTPSGTWRAIADASSGIAFLCVLGWGMWHLGSQLLQLAPQVAAVWERYPL